MDIMPMVDIPQLSMAMSMENVQRSFGLAMLDMSLETAASEGGALADIMRSSMELSVNPDVGANFDMSV